MRNLVLIVAAFLLGLWSLFAWGVYALLGYAGGFAAGNADLIPLPPELTFWVANLLSGAGGVVVWIVWLIGAGVIALVAFVASPSPDGAEGTARAAMATTAMRRSGKSAFPTCAPSTTS